MPMGCAWVVLSLGLTLVVFTNRGELIRSFALLLSLWIPIIAGIGLLSRARDLRGPGVAAGGALALRSRLSRPTLGIVATSFLLAGAGVAFLTTDPRQFLRCLLELVPIGALVLLGLRARRILREWKQSMLLAASIGFSLGLFLWISPHLLRSALLPLYSLDVDHHPRPLTGGTNADGVYSSLAPESFVSEDFNVLFLGDSFTANPTLQHDERFPALVGRILSERLGSPRIQTVNMGWVSSSPLLQLRRLRAIGERYHPDLIVQCLDMSDFHDDLRVSEKLREIGLGRGAAEVTVLDLVAAKLSVALGVADIRSWLAERLVWHVLRAPATIPTNRYFCLMQPAVLSTEAFERTWAAILETRDWARHRGARFVLLLLPRYQQYNRRESPRDWENYQFPAGDEFLLEPHRYFESKVTEAGFPIHSLVQDFRASGIYPTTFEDDPHWNAAGNRVAAESIARRLIEDGSLEALQESP